jgi:exonuclease III
VRLITWNLNARRRQLPDQLAALAARAPDIVALQEVTASSADTLGLELPRIGYRAAPLWLGDR